MNNWLENNEEQIEYFIKSNDIILVGRKYHIDLLLKLIIFYNKTKNSNFLDLGCGDGSISKIIQSKFPNNTIDLLDGSNMMIQILQNKFKSNNSNIINMNFNEWMNLNVEKKYDLIFSSMAIHHLDYYNKNKLFTKIYTALKYDGLFVNIDVVKPVTKDIEDFHFMMWENSIIEKTNNIDESKKHENLPSNYKNKTENKPSTLKSQLYLLENIGFEDVDCHHKDGIFAMFSGVKK
ncbi:MAG: class I SAM-dependent methyltransferase [Spirochaetia bacterium]|nr:class I SAM-dependent methyltransferase [Spirochaetia bacterium]